MRDNSEEDKGHGYKIDPRPLSMMLFTSSAEVL